MVVYADAAPSLAGSTIMLTIVAFITYGLRVYCRLTRKSWGIEDWIMTIALVRTTQEISYGLTNTR
jgi:hypothetical protein